MKREYQNKRGDGGAHAGGCRKHPDNSVAEMYRERFPVLPLDYILSILNGINPMTRKPFTSANRPSPKRIDRLAIAAMGFLHRRLVPLEPKQPDRTMLNLKILTDEELRQLEHIIVKAQIPKGLWKEEERELEPA